MPVPPQPSAEENSPWARLRALLIDPSPLLDAADRQHMERMAATLLPLAGYAMIDALVAPVGGQAIGLVTLALLLIGYAASRTHWVFAPGPLTVLACAVIPYVGLGTSTASTSVVSEVLWSLLLPIAASHAFGNRNAAIVSGLHATTIGLFVWSNPEIPLQTGVPLVCGVAVISVTALFGAQFRDANQLELVARTSALAQAEADLDWQQKLSDNTLKVMGDGVLVTDANRVIRSVNPVMCEVLGYSQEALVGSELAMVLYTAGDEARISSAPTLQGGSSGQTRPIDTLFRTRSGDAIQLSLRVTHLRDSSHGFGLVCLARDMRETLRILESIAETEAARQKSDELQHAHTRLLQTQAQLVQAGKLAAVGELAGAVAHEVNNPLGAALLATDLLEEALEEGAPIELVTRQIAVIHDAISRCQRIINGLLDFARQSTGEVEELDLVTVVEASLRLVSRKLQVMGAEVIVHLPDPLLVRGNRNQLGQVVLNLIMNAAQAVEGQERGQIHIGAKREHGEVALWIRDNGPGIAPFVLKRIFEPFYTTKPQGQGTGLGLSISYGIITEHGGRIDVRSRTGEGATFVIVLTGAASEQTD